MTTPYTVLGLSPNANKDQVKEAFRKLVWQYHPDKAQPELRSAAEAKFKEIKLAYEEILQHEAGYRPPRPGSAPNPRYAEAYWHAHSMDGRVPWGKFAGWETEMQFYKAMVKGGRNNMGLLTVLGLLAVPSIAAGVAILQSFADEATSQQEHALEVAGADGFDVLRAEAYMVNGQMTQANPWAANNVLDTRKYKLAQQRLKAAREAAGQEAAGDGSSTS